MQVNVVITYLSGLRPLDSGTCSIFNFYWDFSWITCFCLVSWRSCSFGSAGLSPSHNPAVHNEVDVGLGLLSRHSGHGFQWVGQSACLSLSFLLGKALQNCLAYLPITAGIKEQGRYFFCSHTLRAGSLAPSHKYLGKETLTSPGLHSRANHLVGLQVELVLSVWDQDSRPVSLVCHVIAWVRKRRITHATYSCWESWPPGTRVGELHALHHWQQHMGKQTLHLTWSH